MVLTSDEHLFERIYDEIVDSQLNICFVKQDVENNKIKRMAELCHYPKQFGTECYEHTKCFSGYLMYVGYNLEDWLREDAVAAYNLLCLRNEILNMIFDIWTERGFNTRHAKKPFKSTLFLRYLDSIEFWDSDYIFIGTAISEVLE